MDFRKIPSSSEVCSWSPDDLVYYFKKCNLKDCEKLVKKQGISGKRFLEMSENDMQRFPKVRVPMLIKIQQQINKKEEKKALFPTRLDVQKSQAGGKFNIAYPPRGYDTDTLEDVDGSNSDSFDEDYEDPDDPDDGADYESPNAEEERNSDVDYEPPPSNNEPILINPSKSNGNHFYADRINSGTVKNPPNPPVRSEPQSHCVRTNTFPGLQQFSSQDDHGTRNTARSAAAFAPCVDRTKKPVALTSQSNSTAPAVSGRNEPAKATTLPAAIRTVTHAEMVEENGHQRMYPHPPHSSNTFPSASPKPSMRNISGFYNLPSTDILVTGYPQVSHGPLSFTHKPVGEQMFEDKGNGRPAPLTAFNNVLQQTESRLQNDLSLEQWYLGKMSRKDAEMALRSINQDGTFLVRNCSQISTSQPYVLMVLYRNKVYNIRIRYSQDSQAYLLGSGGLETFNSVSEIINFFRSTPLLLIDGKDRGSRQHCKLTCVAQKKD